MILMTRARPLEPVAAPTDDAAPAAAAPPQVTSHAPASAACPERFPTSSAGNFATPPATGGGSRSYPRQSAHPGPARPGPTRHPARPGTARPAEPQATRTRERTEAITPSSSATAAAITHHTVMSFSRLTLPSLLPSVV